MAYRVVEGIPGSGKSYYIVHWLASNFCLQLKDGGYVLDPSKKVRVVTNIAGFQIPHEDFQAALDAAGGFEIFFTKEYQSSFSLGWHIIYIFDEAQEWFHPKFCRLTKENLLYFTWARHEGHDIFLLTQNLKLIVYEVACLSEYIVQAQPRSNNVSKELTYVYRTFEGTEIRTERLIFSKKIAALYKSMEKGEAVKIKNYRMRKYMAALAFAVLLMVFGLRGTYSYWQKFMGSGDSIPKSSASASSVSSASSPAKSAAAAQSAPSPVASAQSAVSSVVKESAQIEYYMYRLDWAYSGKQVRFLLGISWISLKDFPYPWVKRGDTYWAMIPAVLLPALENGARALPIRTDNNKG